MESIRNKRNVQEDSNRQRQRHRERGRVQLHSGYRTFHGNSHVSCCRHGLCCLYRFLYALLHQESGSRPSLPSAARPPRVLSACVFVVHSCISGWRVRICCKHIRWWRLSCSSGKENMCRCAQTVCISIRNLRSTTYAKRVATPSRVHEPQEKEWISLDMRVLMKLCNNMRKRECNWFCSTTCSALRANIYLLYI